tara:strand:+ start:17002 stop:18024 length:1023 start_codon:yes stop_codon:yes gene_type:complete
MIGAVLTPLILSAIASTWMISTFSRNLLEEQSRQFGQAIADQLANTSIDYLVSNDVLSLNVVLDELLARHNFDFAAIYNPDSQLLAQSGKHTTSRQSFTRDINFQDANLGHVLIELDSGLLKKRHQQIWIGSLLLHSLIGVLTTLFIWFYGDLAYLWINRTVDRRRTKPADETHHHQEVPTNYCSLLCVKIKPARLVPLEDIKKACALYGGQLEAASNEEWLITFTAESQLFQSICCGLLIKEILPKQAGKILFKAGIDAGSIEDLPLLRKQASYLASVSDQNLVISERVNEKVYDTSIDSIPITIESRQYHSTLITGGEVYVVETNDPIMQQQAKQVKA